MHRTRAFLLTLALAACARPASAQSVAETVWGDLRTVPGDLWYVWSSPARINGGDLPRLAGFVGSTTLIVLTDQAIQEWIRTHERTALVRAFEPFRSRHALSHLGQNHWLLRGVAVGYVTGLVFDQEWLRDASFGCAVGNVSNAVPRMIAYAAVSRPRPAVSDDPYDISFPGGEWNEHSFFGGHAANAFTCASFLAHRFDMGWGEPFVWILATGIAGARLVDDAHWASDTFIGSAYGYFAGRMVADRQLERRAPEATPTDAVRSGATQLEGMRFVGVQATPVVTSEGVRLALNARFIF